METSTLSTFFDISLAQAHYCRSCNYTQSPQLAINQHLARVQINHQHSGMGTNISDQEMKPIEKLLCFSDALNLVMPDSFFFFFLIIWGGFIFLWASLVAQLVKNPSTMWETWVQSLSWEDPLEKGKVQYSSLEKFMDCIVHGVAKSQTCLRDFHFTSLIFL